MPAAQGALQVREMGLKEPARLQQGTDAGGRQQGLSADAKKRALQGLALPPRAQAHIAGPSRSSQRRQGSASSLRKAAPQWPLT